MGTPTEVPVPRKVKVRVAAIMFSKVTHCLADPDAEIGPWRLVF